MMGFWIFMFSFSFFIPLMMILVGAWMSGGGPKEVNEFFGYRTFRSMRSPATWAFAQRYCGRLWKRGGICLFPTGLLMFFVIGAGEDLAGIFGTVLILLQCAVMLGLILPVEQALKRNFDEEGNPK